MRFVNNYNNNKLLFFSLFCLSLLVLEIEGQNETQNETCIPHTYPTVSYTILNFTSFKSQVFPIGLPGTYTIFYDTFLLMYKMAIDWVNNQPDLLPDIRIEGHLCELETLETNALVGVEALVVNKNARALVGPFYASETKVAQLLAQIFQIPLIAPIQTESVLSNKFEYPNLVRTIPSDIIQGKAIAEFIYKQGWRQVMITYGPEIRMVSAHKDTALALEARGITYYSLQLPSESAYFESFANTVKDQMRERRLWITVHLITSGNAEELFPHFVRLGVVGNPKYAHILNFNLTSFVRTQQPVATWASGAVGLIPQSYEGPMYKVFNDIWQTKRGQRGWVADPRIRWYFVDALLTVVYSLDKLIKMGYGLNDITGRMHLNAMRNLTFEGATGTVRIDAALERRGGFNYYNFVSDFSRSMPVGTYNEMNGSILYNNIEFQQGATFIYDGVCPCKYGKCETDSPACTCDSEFTGVLCDKKKKRLDKWEVALIVVIPFLVLLFISYIAYRQILQKKAKAIKDVTERQRSVIPRSEITLSQPIGKGASGLVYKGVLRGTEVAVKKLITDDVTHNVIQAFELESAVMTGLRHPNIVLFMGTCLVNSENEMLLVMEYMHKGSLHDILHNPNVDFPVELALHIALQAAKGMGFLHQSSPPIIHRDLKSHNILLDDKWNARIADFGIARIKDISNNNNKKGKKEKALGTIFWTAPEIFMGQPNTEKSDCYSFGIVLWELVHRADPYKSMDVMTVAYEVARRGLRPNVSAIVPVMYQELMEACWAQNPDDRPNFDYITSTLRHLVHLHPFTRFRAGSLNSRTVDPPAGLAYFVRTRVLGAGALWNKFPAAMLCAINMHNQHLRSLLYGFDGYEVGFSNDEFLFAFEALGGAINFCIAAQTSLLQLAWPPSILTMPMAAQVFKSIGRKLWSGLRVRMAIHVGVPSSEINPATGRTYYFGPIVDRTEDLLDLGPRQASIIVSETIMTKIDTNNIKFTEDITCDICGALYDQDSEIEEKMFSILPLSLAARARAMQEMTVRQPYEGDEPEFETEDDEYDANVATSSALMTSPNANRARMAQYKVMTSQDRKYLDYEEMTWLVDFSELSMKENLGRGPVGDFYRAIWNDTEIVVKELLNQKLQENDMLYLKANVSILTKLRHKNIVPIYGVCFEPGHISLLTEYLPKSDLRYILSNEDIPLPWKIRVKIVQQIAEGMNYITSHPDPDIHIHTTLKSCNIHITNVERGEAKIADVGQGILKDLARTMTSVETATWTAPEILMGEALSPAISVYAFGVIMYEIATRKTPYQDEHPVSLVEKILDGLRPSPIPQCPPGYQEIMERCWDASPVVRPNWGQISQALASMNL